MISEWLVKRALKKADIQVNGGRPWDMNVHDKRVFREILLRGSLGLGESYMKKSWDCEQLHVFFCKLLEAKLDRFGLLNLVALRRWLEDRFVNRAAADREFSTARVHYDLGEDLFSRMLDPLMNYSCALYTKDRKTTLAQAQERKLDLICRKLNLQPGQHVLDIGCGFGAFAKYAAEHYKVRVTGITRSPEQARYARERCGGFPVDILLEDYRSCTGTFDRIVSIGMFEHVESKNDQAYFDCIERCLAPDGLFLLHTIGKTDQGKKADRGSFSDPFMRKYIFPEGMIPDRVRLTRAIDGRFYVLDRHELGSINYALTLLDWHANFGRAWPSLKEKYGPLVDGQFERMFPYYLLSCAGAFFAERLDVWHIVMSTSAVPDYQAVRVDD